jgi:hypothetical protein
MEVINSDDYYDIRETMDKLHGCLESVDDELACSALLSLLLQVFNKNGIPSYEVKEILLDASFRYFMGMYKD